MSTMGTLPVGVVEVAVGQGAELVLVLVLVGAAARCYPVALDAPGDLS